MPNYLSKYIVDRSSFFNALDCRLWKVTKKQSHTHTHRKVNHVCTFWVHHAFLLSYFPICLFWNHYNLKRRICVIPNKQPFRKYLQLCYILSRLLFTEESWINFLPNDPSLGKAFLPRKIGQETQKGGRIASLHFWQSRWHWTANTNFYLYINKKMNLILNKFCIPYHGDGSRFSLLAFQWKALQS